MDDGGEAADASAYEFDFFVSRDEADRDWAKWIAWQIEEFEPEPGRYYRVLLQDWDFVPGSDWVERMERGIRRAKKIITVLSPDYVGGEGFGAAEWRAFWRSDPHGRGRRIVPVQVRPCTPESLLGSIVDIDLVGLSEDDAAERLIKGIRAASENRDKPPVRPSWPGSERAVPGLPPFPGGWIASAAARAAAGTRVAVGLRQEPHLGVAVSGLVADRRAGGGPDQAGLSVTGERAIDLESENSGVVSAGDGVTNVHLQAKASGQGRVYQAGRDQHITER